MANSCKYYKQQRQVSYDGGVSWQNLNEFQKGELYERNSSSCGYMEVTRWVTTGTTCQGYDKYNVQVKEISYDGGTTWNRTTETQNILAERNSTDCGYVPPAGTKLTLYRSPSTTTPFHTADCSGSDVLADGDFPSNLGGDGYKIVVGSCVRTVTYAGNEYYKPSEVVFENGVVEFGAAAFRYNAYLGYVENLVLPDSVKRIGAYCFESVYRLTGMNTGNVNGTITIGRGIEHIGFQAFYYTEYVKSITILATTPPVVESGVFGRLDDEPGCPIYVPAESLTAYKTAESWVRNVDINRIQAIS